ncbi:MAG: Asp-tRNA(Asn)/Glu-tRNA(Gln) amidotransferase subunit GatA [Chlamydiota bacterium]|nr:Asp-tRNA(Asn)/Glu-tRNA(Gln) amidotransferase subunit GatA [Chlamydiota bacterium]
MNDLLDLTIHQLVSMIKNKEISVKELVGAVLNAIQEKNPLINAYIRWDPERALAQAQMCDRKRDALGVLPPLFGIPIANKDVICRKDTETTCSSRILKGYIAPYNATVIDRLEEAGAIIIGNTNMDEFAMGSSTETSCYGLTKNPWSLDRTPGGSSGGSAAAVSGRLAIAALGSDTGGSIRQPASLCGCVGLKPTYGRVSRYGLVAFGSSLDQIGPMTKDVLDAVLLMQVLCGKDSRDSTSVDQPMPDFSNILDGNVKGMKVGLPREYFTDGMHASVKKSVNDAVRLFTELGAHVEECSLPMTEFAVATYYIICTAEASSNLARYDGVQYGMRASEEDGLIQQYYRTRGEGFGEEVKRRIILGTYALSTGYYDQYYLKAQKVRTLIRKDFENAFSKFDVLITPTSPTPAFKFGERTEDPLTMYLSDIYTISANLAGIPGISIPCGFSEDRLPVGLQILASHFQEDKMLKAAFAFQSRTGYHKEKPVLKGDVA